MRTTPGERLPFFLRAPVTIHNVRDGRPPITGSSMARCPPCDASAGKPMNAAHPVLEGIRVIDFGHYLAGPIAGMLLADQGAEVIKVQRPGGPRFESPANAVFNRGKRCIALDLKNEPDCMTVKVLVGTADVVIENFRPGVMDRLGLGAEAMTRLNPRLVYLSLPGFASSDEASSALPAWEGVIGAACGLYSDLNVLRDFLGLPPVYTALPYGSVYGAVHGALAVLMALIARERWGKGDVIEVPLMSAAMSAMGCNMLHIPNQPRRYDIPPVPRLVRQLLMPAVRRVLRHAAPAWQEWAYQAARGLTPALMDNYVCADGRLLYVLAMDHRRHAPDLLGHLNLLEELEREGLEARDPYRPGGGRNNLSEGAGLSARWQRRLYRKIADKLRDKTAETWEAELGSAGVPCTLQRTTKEWLSLEPVRLAGIVAEVDDPDYGRMRQPGPSCWLTGREKALPRFQSAEALGAGQVERLQVSAAERARSREAEPRSGKPDPALDGVRVVDLSTMIAAPVCARTLAEYGAEVIKVASPHPLHGPRMICWFGVDVDQGKRSLLVDFKSEEGKRIVRSLIEQADVLVHNLTTAAARRLGLQREQMARLNPGLILCRVGAFEGPATGPWTERKGYDPVAQAASGIMLRYGDPAQPEYHGIASCIDYITGYSAALAAALALFRRTCAADGKGSEAVTSLAQGAQLAQASLAFDFPGRTWDEPTGQQCRGDHALHRLYRARDRWFFLAAHRDKLDSILARAGPRRQHELGRSGDSEVSAYLERCFRKESTAHWEGLLQPLDVAVMPVRTLREIRRVAVRPRPKARFLSDGVSVQVIRQPHPVGGEVDTVAPAYARLRRHPIRYLDPAPKPGSHSLEILEELGIPADERKRLLDRGIVSVSLADDFLPA